MPGNWGAFYESGLQSVKSALNSTIAGSPFIVFGSSLAVAVSFSANALINAPIGKMVQKDSFATFALRSYVSTLIAQFGDNLVFAVIVSHTLFGWSWLQIFSCAFSAALFELSMEVFMSPLGYHFVKKWKTRCRKKNLLCPLVNYYIHFIGKAMSIC
ncbi:MAG: VUT family protein [Coriobacteriaceae bacterium]|nr:VUT family protein [Coriobacteriaceae bacterium]